MLASRYKPTTHFCKGCVHNRPITNLFVMELCIPCWDIIDDNIGPTNTLSQYLSIYIGMHCTPFLHPLFKIIVQSDILAQAEFLKF